MSDARVLADAPWLRPGPSARVLELLNRDGEVRNEGSELLELNL